MTTCEELKKLLQDPEKEKVRVELKRSNKLRNRDVKDIGYELVALANRYGGKLIFGIKDDATFEGKNIFNVDEDKSLMDNICNNNCSPKIKYDTEFLPCSDGDVLIVHVFKRKGIPHAYLKKSNGEVKNRVYYVRTSYGKRLVTDSQLEYMFKESGDPHISRSFSIQIAYDRRNLSLPFSRSAPIYRLLFNSLVIDFFNELTEKDKKFLLDGEPEKMQRLFLELLPFIVLFELALYFRISWAIKVEERVGHMSWGPKHSLVEKDVHTLEKIFPDEEIFSFNNLSVDVKSLVERRDTQFTTPKGVTVKISKESDGEDRLIMTSLTLTKEDAFEITLKFRMSHWSVNFPPGHPIRTIMKLNEYGESQENYAFVDIDCSFDAAFNFFEYDIEEFNEVYEWAENMLCFLEKDLSWEKYVEELPEPILQRIERDTEEILEKLNLTRTLNKKD